MKTKFLIVFVFSILALNSNGAERVRRVQVQGDQIVTVRTSIGIATIIQVPDRPNSVVAGDQDSFKVEYLDQAVTIKPLAGGARSNLYIYTDWKRFNVELVSGPESVADYVVYLENTKEKSNPSKQDHGVSWIDFKNSLRNDDIELRVRRLGRTTADILLIEFLLVSNKKESFHPEWLWLTQGKETCPIHNLFLSSLDLAPQKTISGVIQIRESDLSPNTPLRLELRRKRISYLTIQKVSSWKR